MAHILTNKVLMLYTIVVTVLCSGHAYQTIFPWVVHLLIPVACLFVLICIKKAGLVLRGIQLVGLGFVLMVLFTMILHLGSGWYSYMLLLCNILVAYGIVQIYSFRQIIKCYQRIMTVVAVVALVGYFLANNTKVLEILPSVSNTNNIEYKASIIFSFMPSNIERNCGMFWEPGLLATHLTIATVFEIMCYTKPRLIRLALFSVCLFTANSSAGFALWFLCLLLLFVKNANISKNIFAGIFSMIVMLAGIAVIVNLDNILIETGLAENQYFQKLSSESITDSSRMKALEHNLKSFLSAPFFGVGVTQAYANMDHVADTSTSTYLLSVFGLLGSLYTICWCYGIFKNVHANIFAKVLLLAIALIIVNKEPHHQILFTWCILFSLVNGNFGEEASEERENKKRKVVFVWG